jgi:predicted tellurium resistance membrane protein TerC
MTTTAWLWIIFTVFVLGMLALDLGVFHRKAHVVTKKEAALWSLVWILLAMVGTKMMLAEVYKIPIGVSLGVIAALLALSIMASLLFPRQSTEAEPGVATS